MNGLMATGLPDALSNTAIPLEARIVTLADVFDALMSKRAYKHAWTLDEVMEYIEAAERVQCSTQSVLWLLNRT